MRKTVKSSPCRSCGYSKAVRMDFWRSFCMAISRPGSAVTQRNFSKATTDTRKPTAIWGITICRGFVASPARHISADTLSTLFLKASSMITANWQCREASTATGYSPLRTPLTKSIMVIMKSGNSCISNLALTLQKKFENQKTCQFFHLQKRSAASD